MSSLWTPEQLMPMDVQRRTDRAVLDRSEIAAKVWEQTIDHADIEPIAIGIRSCREISPLYDQRVTVQGKVIKPAIDESVYGADKGEYERAQPDSFYLAEDSEQEVVEGVYKGYDLLRFYDQAEGAIVPRAIHVIWTGSEWTTFMDKRGHSIVDIEQTLVLVEDSIVEPELPINAHSLKDVIDDPACRTLQRFIGNIGCTKAYQPFQRMRAASQIMSHFLNLPSNPEQRTARLSLLNSYKLLQGNKVVTMDALWKDGDNDYASDDSEEITVYPRCFVAMRNYQRDANGNVREPTTLEEYDLQLGVYGHTAEQAAPTQAPVKNIKKLIAI